MFGANFIIKSLASLDEQTIRVKPMQCSRARHQLSTCQLCMENCPTKAITWGTSLQIDKDKCDMCGICTAACPNGVFELNNMTINGRLSAIVAAIKHNNQIIFTCTIFQEKQNIEVGNNPSSLNVPCLGSLNESNLIYCIHHGINSICLVNGYCNECSRKSGWNVMLKTILYSNSILETFGLKHRIVTLPQIPKSLLNDQGIPVQIQKNVQAISFSRRDFLKSLTKGTAAATILAASNSISGSSDNDNVQIRKSGLPFYLPKKRVSLLESIKGLGNPVNPIANSSDLPFQQLVINGNCTGCGMCVYFCPTNALRKIEHNGKLAIAFELSRCTCCNLCLEICYVNAISIAQNITIRKIIQDKPEVLLVKEVDDSETQNNIK